MQLFSIDYLRGSACAIARRHPSMSSHIDFIALGIATEYLRRIVGNEWTNQIVFGIHPSVARSNRLARKFMRAVALNTEDRSRNQHRTIRLAETLFSLQTVDGIDARIEALRGGNVEPIYAELVSRPRNSFIMS